MTGKLLPFLLAILVSQGASTAAELAGTHGPVGTPAGAKIMNRLVITKPGVYENLIIDGGGSVGGNLVKVMADGVTIRNCEMRNGTGNGIGVFGTRVIIENCLIHHMLSGTYKEQHDAHGITGHWGDVTIRNCDISHTSGDCIQFDPERASSGSLTIEHCHLWTGPLTADILGFKAGDRPGENAVDTKIKPDGPRCELKISHCFMHGWNQPSQINNMAALNLKENVNAAVTNCVFDDNEIALRVRGPGSRGGAHVSITDCAIYNTTYGVRAEDKIEQLKIKNLAIGKGVKERIAFANGKAGPGYENTGEHDAPAIETLIEKMPAPKP